jgi:hypothetical protein
VTNYAPSIDTDLSRAVALRSEITRALNRCTLDELQIIRDRLIFAAKIPKVADASAGYRTPTPSTLAGRSKLAPQRLPG